MSCYLMSVLAQCTDEHVVSLKQEAIVCFVLLVGFRVRGGGVLITHRGSVALMGGADNT